MADCKIGISGYWVSSAGSTLGLREPSQTGELSGFFHRSTGEIALISGMASLSPTDGNFPIAVVANWRPQGKYYASVTSYTGTFQVSQNKIRTIFLSVNPQVPAYESVSVDSDEFTKHGSKTIDDFVQEFGEPTI